MEERFVIPTKDGQFPHFPVLVNRLGLEQRGQLKLLSEFLSRRLAFLHLRSSLPCNLRDINLQQLSVHLFIVISQGLSAVHQVLVLEVVVAVY